MSQSRRYSRATLFIGFFAFIGIALIWHFWPHPLNQSTRDHAILTIQQTTPHTEIYSTGILKPTNVTTIASPADGYIIKTLFQYGDRVKTGQPLFLLSSQKLLDEYRHLLTDYIKAKTTALNSKNQMQQSKLLHQKQLISDDEFRLQKNTWYHDQLTLLQTRASLDSLSRQLHLKDDSTRQLNINNIEKITEALRIKDDALQLIVYAPTDGVILSPSQQNNNTETSRLFIKGDAIKQGEALALIGNTHILRVVIPINEFHINQLHIGMPVSLTGSAFPDIQLHGKISAIHLEASGNQDGTPHFPVEITVPLDSALAKSHIHPGMSSEIIIPITGEPGIMIPIRAVNHSSTGHFVDVIDPKTHVIAKRSIRTGETSENQVMIKSGLAIGDQIVIPG